MIVAVDGRHAGAQRGIARYTTRMCEALAQRGGVTIRPVSRGQIGNAVAALAGWPTLRARTGADVTWLPAPAPAAPGDPYVVTIHDLSWIDRPADFTAYERLWHRLARIERQVRRASAVVCDTPDTAARLADLWGVAPTVIQPGWEMAAADLPEQRERPYFLYVGALEPRKGLDVLERAWADARPDADLLLAGSGRVAVAGAERLGPVSDERLAALYAGALAVVLPSHLEGFGFTPREAAACGTPSIVSDLPSLRIPGALRVPPGDVDAWAEALTVMPSVRDSLIASLPPVRSWAEAAAELEVVLRGACA